jgi:hypothetical protein
MRLTLFLNIRRLVTVVVEVLAGRLQPVVIPGQNEPPTANATIRAQTYIRHMPLPGAIYEDVLEAVQRLMVMSTVYRAQIRSRSFKNRHFGAESLLIYTTTQTES